MYTMSDMIQTTYEMFMNHDPPCIYIQCVAVDHHRLDVSHRPWHRRPEKRNKVCALK